MFLFEKLWMGTSASLGPHDSKNGARVSFSSHFFCSNGVTKQSRWGDSEVVRVLLGPS